MPREVSVAPASASTSPPSAFTLNASVNGRPLNCATKEGSVFARDPMPGVSLWVVTPTPAILSSDSLTPTMTPISPLNPLPTLSKAMVSGLPSNTPTKKLLSISASWSLKRSTMGSLEQPSRIVRMAGPFTNLSCWYSIRSSVLSRSAASRAPETELKTVRTTTIFIISRMLHHLPQCFGF